MSSSQGIGTNSQITVSSDFTPNPERNTISNNNNNNNNNNNIHSSSSSNSSSPSLFNTSNMNNPEITVIKQPDEVIQAPTQEKATMAKSFKERYPRGYKALIAAAVGLGVLAIMAAAALAIHYTVGFAAAKNWLLHTNLTVMQSLLYIGVPTVGAMGVGLAGYMILQRYCKRAQEQRNKITENKNHEQDTVVIRMDKSKGSSWFGCLKGNKDSAKRSSLFDCFKTRKPKPAEIGNK